MRYPHKCTIQQRTESGTGSRGDPKFPWGDLKTSVACHLSEPKTESEIRHPFQTNVGQLIVRLRRTAVTAKNRLTVMVDKAGNTIGSGTYTIMSVSEVPALSGIARYLDLRVKDVKT